MSCPLIVKNILYDDILLACGVKSPISWDMDKVPHALITGITGSGKSYFLLLLLGKIGKHIKDAELYVCDFKADRDYSFLDGNKRFFRFLNCVDGLDEFYNRLLQRQSGEDTSRHLVVLLFEEWQGFCSALDNKKQAENVKHKLSTLLMLGRSFGIQVIISMQRPDSVYLNSARDNFNLIVTLGNISKEARDMLYSNFKDEILPDRSRGTGYLLVNGSQFNKITVPLIGDATKPKRYILKAMHNHLTDEQQAEEAQN